MVTILRSARASTGDASRDLVVSIGPRLIPVGGI
jgi:hypothetical protein